MKIGVAATGNDQQDQVDNHFGRCRYYYFYNLEKKAGQFIQNEAEKAFRGAGISAAQFIADQGVEAVIAGNFGPNAINVLKSAGIRAYRINKETTIKKAVEQFENKELEAVEASTVASGQGGGFGGKFNQ
jgi:predicted Fe-Mo cluster-binding NifX family protein